MTTRRGALHAEIIACRACPRLVCWREQVAREKRARYRDCEYWGSPVPGFGDPRARVVILGLAPGAHGANRTGRIFTGDRSGDFLYAALHRAGFANQPTSVAKDDGLRLRDAFVTCPVRCAPPDNKPAPDEIARCAPFLDRELALLSNARVFIALGSIAWSAYLTHLVRMGIALPSPRSSLRFAHGSMYIHRMHARDRLLLGSFHVSQQNTQTGKLTVAMFDDVLDRARHFLDPQA